MIKFIKNNPLVFGIVYVLLTMILPWTLIFQINKNIDFYFDGVVKYSITLIITIIICFILYKKIPFTLKNPKLLRNLFTFGFLGIFCALMAFMFSFSKPDMKPQTLNIVGFTLYNLAIALSEEFLFRGLILNQMLDKYKNKRNFIFLAVILSSAIFGLRHLINLIVMPNAVVSTIGQVFFTFFAGFYLSCLYIRTRNIWTCIIIHFLEDFFTGFWVLVSSEALLSQGTDGPIIATVLLVAVHSVYVIFGIMMIKDKEFRYTPLMNENN